MNNIAKTARVDSYDFFGYLAPGLVVFLSLLICAIRIKYKVGLIGAFSLVVYKTFLLNNAQFATVVIISLILAYISGHITSSLSSYFFEKTVVGRILGYPYLSIVFGKSVKRTFSGDWYRTFTGLLMLIVFLFVTGIKKPFITIPFFHHSYHMPLCSQVGTLLLLLVLFKSIDSMIRRKLSWFHRNIYQYLLYLPVKIIASVFLVVEKFATNCSGQAKVLPEEIRKTIFIKYRKAFNRDLNEKIGAEAFWSIYWYIIDKNPLVKNRLDKWLILYGFLRNLSCSVILSAVLLVLPERFGIVDSLYIQALAITLFFGGILFSFRYYYIYFGYYSKTVFRAFAYL